MAKIFIPLLILALVGVGVFVWFLDRESEGDDLDTRGGTVAEEDIDEKRGARRGNKVDEKDVGDPKVGETPTPGAAAKIVDLTAPAVRGRFQTPDGEPLAGVSIKMSPQPSVRSGINWAVNRPATVEVVSDAEGLFSAEKLDHRVTYSLRARHPDYRDHVTEFTVQKSEVLNLGDLRVEEGLRLAGVVVDGNNKGVEGIVVMAQLAPKRTGRSAAPPIFLRQAMNAQDAFEATTDKEGRFEFRGLADGTVELRTVSAVHPPAVSRGIAMDSEREAADVRIVLQEGRTVTGVVLDETGKPATGVKLVAHQGDGRSSVGSRPSFRWNLKGRETEVDAEGRFTLAGLSAHAHRMTVSGVGYLTKRNIPVAHDQTYVEVTISRSPTFKGIVVDSGGQPVTSKIEVDLRLQALGRSAMSAGFSEGPRVLTGSQAANHLGEEDADGIFVVVDLANPVLVGVIRAEGYADLAINVRKLDSSEPRSETFTLVREALVRGVAKTPDGAPLANARISAGLPKRGPGAGLDFGRLAGVNAGKSSTATSDADGRFALKGLVAGSYEITGSHEDYVDSEAIIVDAVEGGRDIEVVLRAGARMDGIVRDQDGNPVPSAAVSLSPLASEKSDTEKLMAAFGGAMTARLWTRADESGYYLFKVVEPGDYRAIATRKKPSSRMDNAFGRMLEMGQKGGEEDGVPVSLGLGQELTQDLTLEKRAGVRGVVMNGGVPQAGISISLQKKMAGNRGSLFGLLGGNQVETDKEGKFSFEDLDGGEYKVFFVPPVGKEVAESVTLIPGETREVQLDISGATVRGRVTDARTGRGIAKAKLDLKVIGSDNKPAPGENPFATLAAMGARGPGPKTDAEGYFELPLVSAGTVVITVSAPGYETSEPRNVRVGTGQVDGVNFSLAPAARLTVVVSKAGAGDNLFASVRVKSLDPDRKSQKQLFGAVNGEIKFEGLAAGRYEVIAAVQAATETQTIELRAGDVERMTFNLPE